MNIRLAHGRRLQPPTGENSASLRTSQPFASRNSLQLQLRPHAFLNQLLHLTRPRLIVRSPGLTLCRETEFGVFFREPEASRPWLADPVSGLAIDPAEISDLFFYQPGESFDSCSFELQLKSSGFVVAVQPTSVSDNAVVERICRSFSRAVTDTEALHRAGAGAWLDEELPSLESDPSPAAEPPLVFDRQRGQLEVCPNGPGYGIHCTFTPDFIDHDRNLLRLADTDLHHVVFANLQQWNVPSMSMFSRS